jgi:hypothetical protein
MEARELGTYEARKAMEARELGMLWKLGNSREAR